MSTQNIAELFVTASRKKYHFTTAKGSLDVSDLWDLNLESLDRVAVSLDDAITKAGTKSFINKKSNSSKELEDKLEIVKYVIQVKQEEAEASKVRAEKAAKKERLLQILEKKEDESLEKLSAEDIKKMLAEV